MRNKVTITMLAVAVASYCGTASAQQDCDAEIQQLEHQIQEAQLGERQQQDIQELLDRAERESAGCQQLVEQARLQLEQTSGTERSEQSQAADNTTEVEVQQQAADIEVDAGAPQVAVEQQPAQVEVQQQPPQVEVTQPEADVTVKQAEPEVVVNQAEPEVEVRQSDPQVEVKQAGEPEVTVVQAGDERAAGARSQPETQSVATSSGEISEQEAAQLTGKTAVSSDGEEIGEIATVVKAESGTDLYAVVDVGGFLGIGERSIAIPLQDAEVSEEGDLRVSATKEELDEMPEYDPQQYQQFGLVQ